MFINVLRGLHESSRHTEKPRKRLHRGPGAQCIHEGGGRSRWTAPTEVSALIVPAGGALAPYQPSQRYFLVDVGRYRNEDLPERNLVSALIALENSRLTTELRRAVDALVDWVRESEDRRLEASFGEWIRRALLPGRFGGVELPSMSRLEEVQMMLAERVKEWTEQWRQEGLQQGIEQGIERGRAEERALLCRMAARKFGPESADGVSEVLDGICDHGRLTAVGEWLIECDTGAELLEHARQVVRGA